MRNLYKILVGSALVVGSLDGCSDSYYSNMEKKIAPENSQDYFAELPMSPKSNMAMMTNGDFDGDGDLDLIVGTINTSAMAMTTNYSNVQFYFFENDGKGNFTLKKPEQ